MNAVQTRQRPELAGTGREVDTSIQAVREDYHGTTPESIAPTPRYPLTIARKLYSAADRLAGTAEDTAAGALDARGLEAADRLLVGIGRLITELRQRLEATP
ncbi:MAG: hypothetical protein ACREPY_09100 [Rhodanobacteraceae bacterium]